HSGSLTVPLRLLIVEDGAMLSALAPTACQSLLELCDEDVDFMPMSNDQTERVIIDDDLYQPARDDVRKEQLERGLTELKKKQQLEQDRQKALEREQEITQKKIELELLKKKEQEERAKQEQERSEGKGSPRVRTSTAPAGSPAGPVALPAGSRVTAPISRQAARSEE